MSGKLASRVTAKVHIIGAGLLGASLGLALRAKGVRVSLADISPAALALAIDYGAGEVLAQGEQPELVVVATPPDQAAETIAAALKSFQSAIVTDVTSVKLAPLKALQEQGVDITRYVGSHPMAGREKGGVTMARADLFVGRPWVICRDAQTPAAALSLIEAVALEVGAVPVEWQPDEHDKAVAAVSHLPQVVASAVAAQLVQVKENYLDLAAGGLRDTTRIASSDPALWVQILAANAQPVAQLVKQVASDLDAFANALLEPEKPGSKVAVAQLLAAGNAGVARVPGKHGSGSKFTSLTIIIEDRPGQLAALFTDLEELEINMEDMRLEHSPGAQIGFIEISVLPEVSARAVQELRARGWRLV